MVLLYILIIAVLILVVLTFLVASKIIVHFNSDDSDLNVTLLWLYPILKSVVSSENEGLTLSIFLFNKKILKKPLKTSKTNVQNRNLLSKVNPTDIHISARYGFKDPYFTGLAFAALNMIPRFFALESLYQKPDFVTNNDFVNIDATARLNLGRFLLKLV